MTGYLKVITKCEEVGPGQMYFLDFRKTGNLKGERKKKNRM